MDTATAGALPVRACVDDHLRSQLVPFLEGTLGWQVTEGDELPAALALVGVDHAPTTDVPAVLLVRDHDPPDRAARAATRAAAVLRWPDDRDALDGLAADLLARHDRRAVVVPTIRLGGAAGGVGTTTATLALAGLLAWDGQPTLAVASGDVPLPDVPVVDPAALAAHRTWDAAGPVAGVPGLRVVATGLGPRAPVAVPDDVLVLRDDGVASEVDVLVCTRDRAGLAAVDGTAAAAVVVVGRGALSRAAWDRAMPGRTRQVHLPWSARVAHAGLVERVPSSLPGRWLAALVPLARSLRT